MDEELYFSLIDEHLAREHAVGVILLNPDKQIVSVSGAAEALLGVTMAEAAGHRCEEVLQFDLCATSCPFETVLSEGRVITRGTVLCSHVLKEPRTIWLSLAPLTTPDGEKFGVVEILHERKQPTRHIDKVYKLARESEEESIKLAAITDSISQGIFTVDSDCRITFLNTAGREITGYDESEVLGKTCWEAFHGNLCSDSCPVEQTLAEGRPIRDLEMVIRDRWEEEVPVRVSTTILRDRKGNFLGAVETFQDLREIKRLTKALERRYRFENIVGHHSRMEEIFELIHIAAESDVRVLVQGESGTGKELIAKAIHYNSDRKDGPFTKVVCGAMPESLLESELFGHVKGAFTGAHRDKRGRLELAHGGTVFLDEVADISLTAQVKLLRFLQEQEFEPLGGTTTKKVDARVIAATNKDLEACVATGLFREDLYYRLNVFAIPVPPLRERKEDIPLLVSHILDQLNARQPKGVLELSSSTLNLLMNYDWPGNVRELENAIEHAFVCTKGDIILSDALPSYLRQRPIPAEERAEGTMDRWLGNRERDLILSSLEESNWHLVEASKRLGISRTTLWRKMKKHKIVRR
jgi:PAS domain S-box-containing protein